MASVAGGLQDPVLDDVGCRCNILKPWSFFITQSQIPKNRSLLDNLGILRITPAVLDLFIVEASRGYVVIDASNFQCVHSERDRQLLLRSPETRSPRWNSKDSNWLSVMVILVEDVLRWQQVQGSRNFSVWQSALQLPAARWICPLAKLLFKQRV